MSEVRDIEGIVAQIVRWIEKDDFGTSEMDICIGMLIADWRAKKAALEKIVMRPQGSSPNEISSCLNDVKWIARTALHGYPASGQDPPPPPQSTAYSADSQDGQA